MSTGAELQDRFYAEGERALLVILQGLDAVSAMNRRAKPAATMRGG
jgi:hypothetical protein